MPRRHIPQKHSRYQPPPSDQSCANKRRFPTEKQALYAAETQVLSDMQLTLGVYKCDSCRGWHLTSLSKTKNAE